MACGASIQTLLCLYLIVHGLASCRAAATLLPHTPLQQAQWRHRLCNLRCMAVHWYVNDQRHQVQVYTSAQVCRCCFFLAAASSSLLLLVCRRCPAASSAAQLLHPRGSQGPSHMHAHVQSRVLAGSALERPFCCLTVMCGRSRVSLQPEEVLAASGVERKQWRDADQYRPSYKCTTPLAVAVCTFVNS